MDLQDSSDNQDMRRFRSSVASSSSCTYSDTEHLATAAVAARAACATPKKLHSGMSRHELREHMDAQTNEVSETLRGQTRRRALEAIEELPEQVEEVLQQSVSTLFEEVQGKVAAMQEMVREQGRTCLPLQAQEGGEAQKHVDRAMESLDCIPTLILDNFEHNVAKVKDTIRKRVDGVIEGVKGGHYTSNDEIVATMRSLPEEVQQLAGEALEAAEQESKIKARQQFEEALQKLPEGVLMPSLSWQIVERVPRVPVDAEIAAREAAVEPCEQAVAVVQGQEDELNKVVANQVVADFLMRAKSVEKEAASLPFSSPDSNKWVALADLKDKRGAHLFDMRGSDSKDKRGADQGQSQKPLAERERSPQLQLLNAGSWGHPELCTRPCLYFATGECKNGRECDFCHLDHPRRPAHLDKRHRAMLQQLPLEECLSLLAPVLRQKVRLVTGCRAAMDMVESLATIDAPPGLGKPSQRRSNRQLAAAMEVMSLRMLLTSLHRSAISDSPRRKQVLDDLLVTLREESVKTLPQLPDAPRR